MDVTAGSRIGPYEILSRIGAGGMGEVWQARDTRLDRSVAIKILPAEFAQNAQLKLRFEREARTISQLNHPHICTLYDVGDGYLVMELLEGESLADRIARGPLPLADIIKYGAQIAQALDRAHRGGVIHRDLKPANVMITRSGAKLLDFGLAKGGGIEMASDGATMQKSLTQEGTILGTFQYMAPEQLEGQEADARTDIFALGALLYEMATGRRAFDGKTKTSLIAAIVSSTPRPLSEIAPLTPPALDHVIAKCLEKDPDDRWQSAHDIGEELRWIGSGSGQAAAVQSPRRRRKLGYELVAALLGIIAGAAAVWGVHRYRTVKPAVTRTSIVTPADAPLATYGPHRVAISPDGRAIVYVAIRNAVQQMYLRRLDSLEAVALSGTEGGTSPFFSPDSESIGFFDGKHLRRMSLSGGAPQTIADAVDVRWATWTTNDTIIFASGTEGFFSVPADGGTPKAILHNARSYNPTSIPGTDAILTSDETGAIFAIQSSTGKTKKVFQAADNIGAAVYTPGHIVFNRGRMLFAVPFDVKNLQVKGSPRLLADNVAVTRPFGTPLFGISMNGTLVYVPETANFATSTLVWVDRKGTERPVASMARAFEEPRLSPDGTKIVVTVREANPDLWLLDVIRGVLTRFTFEPEEEETPVWSPDGKWIAFSAARRDKHPVLWKAADGSGSEQLLADSKTHAHAGSWAPDSSSFVFTDYRTGNAGDLWVASLTGTREIHPLLQTPFNERAPEISPDGHWLAYISDESGRDEVYVQSYPKPGAKFQVSTEGGGEPVWSPRGDELFYRRGDMMMAVPVEFSPTFAARNPEMLFKAALVPSRRGEPAYDVSRDGKTFLMVRREAESNPTQIVVVSNFLER